MRAPRRALLLAGCLGALALAGLHSASALASPPSLTVLAGTGTDGPAVPGPAAGSTLNDLEGVGVDAAGNLYVPDNASGQIDKITPDGTLSVIAGNGSSGPPVPGPALNSPFGHVYSLTVDPAGDVFVTDWHYFLIEKISPDGMLSIVAGDGTYGPTVAGSPTGTSAGGGYAIGADAAGDVFFFNDFDYTLWKVTPAGVLTHIAGNGLGSIPVAGPALQSPLGFSYGNIGVDSAGDVYLGDDDSAVVDKITPGGMLSIVAGDGTGVNGTPVPGPATSSPIQGPDGTGVDAAGNLYIADRGADVIEQVTPAGTLSIFAGDGTSPGGPAVAGPPTGSAIYPHSIVVDSAGNVVFTSRWNQVLRIGPAEPSAPRNVAVTPGDGTAALTFDPPVSQGTSLVSGYEVSTDGGATWHTLATTAGAGGRLAATVVGLTDGTTYNVLVRALNSSGSGTPSPNLAATPVAPVVPVRPLAAAPSPVSPIVTKISPFLVAVRFHLPAGCRTGCVIKRATLTLRDGTTVLGTRRDFTVTTGGWVRFTIPVSKAVLVSSPGQHPKPGWRTTLTQFAVSTRGATGAESLVKHGHITINLARLRSGFAPVFPGLL